MVPSKTYNLPGLSYAYAIIENVEPRSYSNRAINGIITEVNAFGYAGCAAAYKHGEPWCKELIQHLANNRDLFYQFISERVPEISIYPMEATCLAWLGLEKLGLQKPAEHFEKYGVGLSDGRFFGNKDYLRLILATHGRRWRPYLSVWKKESGINSNHSAILQRRI